LLISIITPCLNRVEFVAVAIQSVLDQNYPQVEHIIMDGGSTDGTLEILSGYAHLEVFSQSDSGIYDAINKGIKLAHGEVIGVLNTDDFYEPQIFDEVADLFINHPEIDAIVGNASILVENTPGEWGTLMTFPRVQPNQLLARATTGAPTFNSWFFRKRLCEDLGGFDIRYLYVADRDFLIRMALKNKSFLGLDRFVYHYRMHPGSITLSGTDSGEADYMFESRNLAERYLKLVRDDPGIRHYFKE
jgi:glycosyltransferase involved in cell wall biosynthesis